MNKGEFEVWKGKRVRERVRGGSWESPLEEPLGFIGSGSYRRLKMVILGVLAGLLHPFD